MGCATSKTKPGKADDRNEPHGGGGSTPKEDRGDDDTSIGSDFEDEAPPPPRTYRASTMLLGKGGSAVVYAGVCEQDMSPVAIKRVQINNDGIRRALEREYATLEALPDHDRVVKVFHFEASGDDGIIVLELVKGGTLRRLCRAAPQRRLHERSLRVYMRDCLLGLAHLHANAVVHRDLKPDNLLVANKVSGSGVGVGGDGSTVYVKITDFGSCKETLHGGVCQTTVNVVGTVPYMSPEAVRGKFSEASDVWAFAMTFIELATPRQRLWTHLGVTETFAMLLRIGALKPPHHRHPIPEWLSPAAHEVLRDCLAFDPADRPLCTELLQRPYFADVVAGGVVDGMESVEDFEAAVA